MLTMLFRVWCLEVTIFASKHAILILTSSSVPFVRSKRFITRNMSVLKGLGFLLAIIASCCLALDYHSYTITRTWDNRTTDDFATINVEFLQAPGREDEGFIIEVNAPFYDDPRLPEGTPPGCYEGLWDFEVVEVFFLGPAEKYLEIELGPQGNYLVYYLEGIRNVTNKALFLDEYNAYLAINKRAWKGQAFIPWTFLPPGINMFNAYAIHKSDPNRVYMSLFPVPQGSAEGPDFHFLDPFEEIDLSNLNGTRNSKISSIGT